MGIQFLNQYYILIMVKKLKNTQKPATDDELSEDASEKAVKTEKQSAKPAKESSSTLTATPSQPQRPANLQVFISGIPYESTEAQLKEFFNLKDSNLAQFITEVKLPRFQDSGKCRGYAHVAFSS